VRRITAHTSQVGKLGVPIVSVVCSELCYCKNNHYTRLATGEPEIISAGECEKQIKEKMKESPLTAKARMNSLAFSS